MGTARKHKLDYSDYAAIPDDGKRYEVLEGGLLVTPTPGPSHQRASKKLQDQLRAYFEASSLGEVFDAPIDVILGAHDILQPDLVVVARPEQVSERGIEGAPLLIVEILSPSTSHRDRGIKARRCAALGVPHYWIVDPPPRTAPGRRAASASPPAPSAAASTAARRRRPLCQRLTGR
jgi:Uma2 family endonuclease